MSHALQSAPSAPQPDGEAILLDLAKRIDLKLEAVTINQLWISLGAQITSGYEQHLGTSDAAKFARLVWDHMIWSADRMAAGGRAAGTRKWPDWVTGVYMIGSIARAEACEESDIDWNFVLRTDHGWLTPQSCFGVLTRDREIQSSEPISFQRFAQEYDPPVPDADLASARCYKPIEVINNTPFGMWQSLAPAILLASYPAPSPPQGDNMLYGMRRGIVTNAVTEGRRVEMLRSRVCVIASTSAETPRLGRDPAAEEARIRRRRAHVTMSAVTQAFQILALEDMGALPANSPGAPCRVVPYWRMLFELARTPAARKQHFLGTFARRAFQVAMRRLRPAEIPAGTTELFEESLSQFTSTMFSIMRDVFELPADEVEELRDILLRKSPAYDWCNEICD